MNKLLSVIVAAMFAAVSVSALAASHAGAQMKDDAKKTQKKGEGKKKSEGKKGEPKKTQKKGEGKKKDEMKK